MLNSCISLFIYLSIYILYIYIYLSIKVVDRTSRHIKEEFQMNDFEKVKLKIIQLVLVKDITLKSRKKKYWYQENFKKRCFSKYAQYFKRIYCKRVKHRARTKFCRNDYLFNQIFLRTDHWEKIDIIIYYFNSFNSIFFEQLSKLWYTIIICLIHIFCFRGAPRESQMLGSAKLHNIIINTSTGFGSITLKSNKISQMINDHSPFWWNGNPCIFFVAFTLPFPLFLFH